MSKRKTYILLAVAAVAVVGFFIIRGTGSSMAAAERLQLEITAPASRTSVTGASTTVTGIISNAAAGVQVNEAPVTVSGDGGFSHEVPLSYGTNRISVQASGEGFTTSTRTVSITREMVLDVLAPIEDSVSSVDTITVHGTVSDIAATIMVAGTAVDVAEDGTWSLQLNLHYPLTVINVTASLEGIDPITRLISVKRGAA